MKKLYLLQSLIAVFILSACNMNPESDLFIRSNYTKNLTDISEWQNQGGVDFQESALGVNLNNDNTDLNEAVYVAQRMYRENSKTKHLSGKIKNVIPIKGENNEINIYVINFDDGYIVVSGTKKFQAVLAYVEHGTYSPTRKKTGEDYLIDTYLQTIDSIKSLPKDFKYTSSWLDFIETKSISKIKTRAMDDDRYWDALNSWYGKYDTSGDGNARMYKCYGSENTLPDGLYDQIVNSYFYDQDAWEGTDYRWENTAYIVEYTTNTTEECGPLMKTKWTDEDFYRGLTFMASDSIASLAVATGQIMRYHKSPHYYPWDEFPDNGNDSKLTSFLINIGTALNRDVTSGEGILKIQTFLEENSYNTSFYKKSYISDIKSEIRRNRPVICTCNGTYGTRHGWVTDGFKEYSSYKTYKLYFLDRDYYPDFVYREENLLDYANRSFTTLVLQKWGCSEVSDGWYFENQDVTIHNKSTTQNRMLLKVYP